MSEYRRHHRGLPDLGHRFPVDARCDCGVAMSFLIREGAVVAERAAHLLGASIRIDVTRHDPDPLDPLRQLDEHFGALNLALLRYSAGAHMKDRVGVVLGEMVGPWQPMETAPMDGTRVLLFARDKYYPPHSMQPLIASWSNDGGDGKPYWRWQVPGYTTRVLPTHWMPLPPDPDGEVMQ